MMTYPKPPEDAPTTESGDTCPKCGTPLAYFSGLENIPPYLYCPKCNDVAYDDHFIKPFAILV